MRYQAFEQVMSQARMSCYLAAVGGDTRKAMTLYRYNLQLSQKLFTIESCFEVALRNQTDTHYVAIHSPDWLNDAVQTGGFFVMNRRCQTTVNIINDGLNQLGTHYSHPKLVAELGFGFWPYMFGPHQYRAAGQNLIRIFPNRPTSTRHQQYNNIYVFNELRKINDLRNRLAHHEPVCFQTRVPVIDTTYASDHYQTILRLFKWMDIDHAQLFYGLDQVNEIILKIDNL